MTAVDVSTRKRIITVIAVPYDEPAIVEVRGEVWTESFDRHAFDGIESDTRTVRVNRDHDRSKVVGRVIRWHPGDPGGLLAEVRIAPTPLGDETLVLAEEDMLSASVGYAARPSDVVHDRRKMTRRVTRAIVDHLSFVASPAYEGARIVEVRDRPATPALDAAIRDGLELDVWAHTYLKRRAEANVRAERAARRNARELREAVDEYLAEPVSAPARYNFGGSWGRWASQIRPS